ncbi:hypothetical protein FRC08_003976 [Ceratobasidium sp. 394]|nr:hypothetical protein FRC08_003976 [Ceratobasidium sp. 394]KAG9094054.1 hypothetical protein FS749_013209 [Ceratobasidium sp. UAMH 11750]
MARGVGTQPDSVVLTVPRHASAAASEELINEVKKIAGEEGKNFVNDFGGGPHTARSRAMAQASEWNSLLTGARAARGPQWDVGIQQYLVDKESDLYYNPTPLSQIDNPNDPSRASEAPDGFELAPGMAGNMQPNSEGGTPLTPRFADDGPVERRRTRAGGGF